ncbi:MAG: LegC family aminotransferase [Gemmatimonadetes bacterium]|nr:MAG: LegC family aminotransferase [Gemmatimonadota bacterium]
MIPLSVPSIRGNEWVYIKDCLDTGWVSSAGAYVERFEQDICRVTGADYAVACVNGSAALQVALQVVGVQADDEVMVPTLTFIAPVNTIRYLNANPIFMDADAFYNIDVEKTIQFIQNETVFREGFSYNKTSGKRISAIIPVHIYGNAVDLESLVPICQERNIKIVEDATESLGTYYTQGNLNGQYTGTIGDVGCYSFNGNKIITTGGGGMIVTSNEAVAQKARYLTTQAKDDPVRYIHHEVGYNFRLTNIQAAMGVAQLEKLAEYIEIKTRNYKRYQQEIEHIRGLHIAETPNYACSNYWFYCLQIDKDIYGKDREQLMAFLAAKGVQARPVWYLNHRQKPYRHCQSYQIETAWALWEKTLNLPCSVDLTPNDVAYVVSVLKHA